MKKTKALIISEGKRIGIIGDEEFLTNLKKAIETALLNGIEKFKVNDKTIIVKLEESPKPSMGIKLGELEVFLDRWTEIRNFLLSLISSLGEKCLEEKERGKHECYDKMLFLLRETNKILFADGKRIVKMPSREELRELEELFKRKGMSLSFKFEKLLNLSVEEIKKLKEV